MQQPDRSSEMSDWIRRGGVAVPDEAEDVDAQTAAAIAAAAGADGGAHGAPPEPEPDVDRAIRDAFARSPKRL